MKNIVRMKTKTTASRGVITANRDTTVPAVHAIDIHADPTENALCNESHPGTKFPNSWLDGREVRSPKHSYQSLSRIR